ncbi:hypothetical protein OG923_34585 (plasmid) [Streptomyces halstedii]|uniref:hypothetical protein n=1 Tax=Streptomyces halstedii TaxID=1944 RepID=UPI002F9188B3
MAEGEIRHPALDGTGWPAIGVRVRCGDTGLRAASWRLAPHTVLWEVLLPCTWPELERLAGIATGTSRARVYVRSLGEAGAGQLLVLCLRGAGGAVRVEGPLAPVAEVLAARARAAVLNVAAVHCAAGREEEARLWRAWARRILKDGRAARRGGAYGPPRPGCPPSAAAPEVPRAARPVRWRAWP